MIQALAGEMQKRLEETTPDEKVIQAALELLEGGGHAVRVRDRSAMSSCALVSPSGNGD
jgi:hypothetical protein